MESSQLIAMGQRLAKDGLLLTTNPEAGGHVGYWGGDAPKLRSATEWRHWITIDTQWLLNHGFNVRGILSLFESKSENERFDVEFQSTKLTSIECTGTPLYGKSIASYPPIDALLDTDSAVSNWLAQEHLSDIGSSRRARLVRKTGAGHAYNQWYLDWQGEMMESALGVLGGWHIVWPEDRSYERPGERLALWLFEEVHGDPEPYVEVWVSDSGDVRVIPRVTF